MTAACKDCRFSTADSVFPHLVRCRRRAPVIDVIHSMIPKFPDVEPDFWCGEFEISEAANLRAEPLAKRCSHCAEAPCRCDEISRSRGGRCEKCRALWDPVKLACKYCGGIVIACTGERLPGVTP